MRFPRITPSLAVAALALFVALGGTALAVSSKARPVVACGNGSVKAFAAVQLDTYAGSFPSTFSGDAGNFATRWSCNGQAAQVRSTGSGSFQIRFPGVPMKTVVAGAFTSVGRPSDVAAWISGDVIVVNTGDSSGSVGFSIAVF